jgi:hypothetical protein
LIAAPQAVSGPPTPRENCGLRVVVIPYIVVGRHQPLQSLPVARRRTANWKLVTGRSRPACCLLPSVYSPASAILHSGLCSLTSALSGPRICVICVICGWSSPRSWFIVHRSWSRQSEEGLFRDLVSLCLGGRVPRSCFLVRAICVICVICG